MNFPPSPPPPQRPERSRRLHNFTLPYLRWGHQRHLRCVKLPHHRSPSSPSPDRTAHSSPGGGEFGHVEKKLRLDLVYDSKPMVSALGNGGGGGGGKNGDFVAAAARPWNLRTRRAACNEPGDESKKIIGVVGDSQKNEKLKFSVALLRDEIEVDFLALIGKRPPRRPKKRPKIVQKQLNTIFPGFWLAEEVTADSYHVPEAVECKSG